MFVRAKVRSGKGSYWVRFVCIKFVKEKVRKRKRRMMKFVKEKMHVENGSYAREKVRMQRFSKTVGYIDER